MRAGVDFRYSPFMRENASVRRWCARDDLRLHNKRKATPVKQKNVSTHKARKRFLNSHQPSRLKWFRQILLVELFHNRVGNFLNACGTIYRNDLGPIDVLKVVDSRHGAGVGVVVDVVTFVYCVFILIVGAG